MRWYSSVKGSKQVNLYLAEEKKNVWTGSQCKLGHVRRKPPEIIPLPISTSLVALTMTWSRVNNVAGRRVKGWRKSLISLVVQERNFLDM